MALLLLAACATARGTARADRLTKDVTAQVPKTWKLAGQPNRGGALERIYALPNGCAVDTIYTECPPTGECDYNDVYTADGLQGRASDDNAGCCANDLCMPTPVKGHFYTCDTDPEEPPPTAHLARSVKHRRDGGWKFDTATFQFFFATKQPKVGSLAVVLQCPAAAYAAEKPEFDAFVKTIKHARDIGPPK